MDTLQMTWQPGLVKLLKREHGSPPLGLRNLGNSCYLNSVLQCLTYTPPLASICLRFVHSSICDMGTGKEKKGDCPFCILEKRIIRSLCSEASCDAPIKINSCLRIYAADFHSGRQEDAHEFLRYVIDACHNTCLRLKKLQQQHQKLKYGVANGGNVDGTNESVVKEIFGGALQSQVKCLSCGAESNKVDEIMDISLDILHSKSLKEALQKFFQPEILDGNNKYKCDNCKELVAARKQMSILDAPNVLVIQLKRFEGIFGGKVDKPITFDETLVLSSYMCKASEDLHPEYNLFGTIVHSGFSPDSGHYYAYIKDAFGRWYCCNDSYVSASTLQEVLLEKVYILFFSRTKQRPRARIDVVANGSKCHGSNGSNTSITEKTVFPNQISDDHLVTNSSAKPRKFNGIKTFSQNSPCLEKPVTVNIYAYHSKDNSSTFLATDGTKTSTRNRSDHIETPVCIKELSDHPSETSNLAPSVAYNSNNSAGIQTSAAFPESSNMKDSTNLHNQTSNHTRNGLCSQQKNISLPGSTGKPLANGRINISSYKKESRKENGYSEPSIKSEEKEKNGRPVYEANGMSKMSADVNIRKNDPLSLRVVNGQSGSIAVDSSGRSSSQKSLDCHGLQNGDIMRFYNNAGMKRKIADDPSCILLAGDANSRAEVEAFKDMIGKEASIILRSCGWSDQVHNFMHERKKTCQEDGKNVPRSMLISHAKKFFISKVPESLKARLIEHLKKFSQEKQSSGT